MVFELEDPSEHQYFDNRRGKFRNYEFSEEEQKQAGSPFPWEGKLSATNTLFSGKIFYWKDPLKISVFLLVSEKSIVIGHSYGPSFEELFQLLEGLQVINHQDGLLRQYQHDFENPDL